MLGLAGSNTVSLQPAVRIACTDQAFNVKTRHAVIKRVTDPYSATEKGPKTRMYVKDQELQERLNAYVSKLDPPYPNPDGKGTNRVPVRLLSSRVDEIVRMRRKMQTGPQLQCECAQWREKTEAEAKADGLPWPPPQDDRERYFVSSPNDESGGATWYEYGNDFRISAKKAIRCNPMTCPYAGAFVPKGKFEAKPCKPEVEINCQLADWGGGELCFVHAESWATAQRFPTSLATVFQACGGVVAGIEVDVCLEYTKAQSVPGGSKTRHPYWVVAIPYGMSETEFRARAIQRQQKLLTDVSELARLNAMTQQLLGEAQMPWRAGALLPEFQQYRALPAAREGDAHQAEQTCSAEDQSEATGILVEVYGKTEEEAAVLVRANADDLGSMFERLGPPPEPVADDELPPAIEGILEDEDVPFTEDTSTPDGDFSPIPPAVETPPAAEEQPLPELPDVPPEAAPSLPVEDLQMQAPPEEPPKLFPTPPDNCYQIQARFIDLDEEADFKRLLAATWKKVTGSAKQDVPSEGTCPDAALLQELQRTLLAKAEGWWVKIGHEKHKA